LRQDIGLKWYAAAQSTLKVKPLLLRNYQRHVLLQPCGVIGEVHYENLAILDDCIRPNRLLLRVAQGRSLTVEGASRQSFVHCEYAYVFKM